MLKVFYICDRKRECHTSPGCGINCKHTRHEQNALYGPSDHPMSDPRFEKKYGALIEREKDK